ncbi:hypothetical protein GW17_00004488, partial [Ensete ventricosum]
TIPQTQARQCILEPTFRLARCVLALPPPFREKPFRPTPLVTYLPLSLHRLPEKGRRGSVCGRRKASTGHKKKSKKEEEKERGEGVMASSGAEVVAAGDGPVLSLMSKRLRALRKKYNRILQMEERLAQGKPLNKEQEEVLRSKPAIAVLIDEYEKLRQPLAVALQEELARAAASPPPSSPSLAIQEETHVPTATSAVKEEPDLAVRDILTLLYFGCLFDVKPQSEFAATMLTRTHERGCCLTYDYVTDDAIELLGERDLDAISALGSLVTSRPVYSGVSHKNALEACLQHAKHWLSSVDQPILTGTSITYAELREKLNKILASDYFTTTPEMKAPGDVAAAVGKYGVACQVPISEYMVAPSPVVQTEGAPTPVSCQQKVTFCCMIWE